MAIIHKWNIVKISSEFDIYDRKTNKIVYKILTTDSNNPAYLFEQTHEQEVSFEHYSLPINECIEQLKLLLDVVSIESFGESNLIDMVIPIVES